MPRRTITLARKLVKQHCDGLETEVTGTCIEIRFDSCSDELREKANKAKDAIDEALGGAHITGNLFAWHIWFRREPEIATPGCEGLADPMHY